MSDYAKMLVALGTFQADLTGCTNAVFERDPDSNRVAIILITQEYPGGFALICDPSTVGMLEKALKR